MSSVAELLLATLEDLLNVDLKTFKWHLTQDVLEGFPHIPVSQLENADRLDITNTMVETYGPEGAVKISLEILRKRNQNQLSDTLNNQYNEVQYKLKSFLKKKYSCIYEGTSKGGDFIYLDQIYTELHVIEGAWGGTTQSQPRWRAGISSAGEGISYLITGELLPSALIWITSRPAAANQIPRQHIHQWTDLQGFNDQQKEKYLASRIINHVRSSRSLHIMCHIPVFCWILATVLEKLLDEAGSGELPKTLTETYLHFLIFQTDRMRAKGNSVGSGNIVLKLGELAFHQLEKGYLIFYEEDLTECGIGVRKASVYSGLCTEIFKVEGRTSQKTVFSFVHLSIQECLAAVYVFLTFMNCNKNPLVQQNSSFLRTFWKHQPMMNLLKSAVDKALKSKNGHLDLFLRFLLGLSLESNQTLLQGLLTQTGSSSQTNEEIVKYIKMKIRKNPSQERCINLFHCLSELNDHSLVKEIQSYLSSGSLSAAKLSPALFSALVFVLLSSEEELDVFNLKKYFRSEEGLLRMLPVVKASRTAL
eukprot:XP_014006078.1 PREDICTED: protein NLRC3-like [Salmo salar]